MISLKHLLDRYGLEKLHNLYDPTEVIYYLRDELEPRTIEGLYNPITEIYVHPYFPDKKVVGFELVKPYPHFDNGVTYLLQSGGSNGDYIISNKGLSRYSITECFNFPEYFKPKY